MHELRVRKDGSKIGIRDCPDVSRDANSLRLATGPQNTGLRLTGEPIRDPQTTFDLDATVIEAEWRFVAGRLRRSFFGIDAKGQKGPRKIDGIHVQVSGTEYLQRITLIRGCGGSARAHHSWPPQAGTSHDFSKTALIPSSRRSLTTCYPSTKSPHPVPVRAVVLPVS